ncbi:unnamed protein product [Meganyctiphanes norvegica]|uniref:Uncharacterized protein n=1 Tax=Meganyctiphanes norvegica TaxID=48144 RepID=A0AAV2SXU6_MEGNR
MQFYTYDHENRCQWYSASTLNMKKNLKKKKKKKKKKKNLISSPRPTKELTKRRFLRDPLKYLILSSGVSEFFRGVLDHIIFQKKKKKKKKKPKHAKNGPKNPCLEWAGRPKIKLYT